MPKQQCPTSRSASGLANLRKETRRPRLYMQYCGVRVPSRPALQRLAAGDAASDSDAAEPESPAQKRHIIITRLGGASEREIFSLLRVGATRSGPKCKKKAAQKRRNKLEELPRSDRNGPLCGEQCDGVHSFYWSVGIGAPPPCHGHRACHGHLAPSPLSWPPSQWLCDAAQHSDAAQPCSPRCSPRCSLHSTCTARSRGWQT